MFSFSSPSGDDFAFLHFFIFHLPLPHYKEIRKQSCQTNYGRANVAWGARFVGVWVWKTGLGWRPISLTQKKQTALQHQHPLCSSSSPSAQSRLFSVIIHTLSHHTLSRLLHWKKRSGKMAAVVMGRRGILVRTTTVLATSIIAGTMGIRTSYHHHPIRLDGCTLINEIDTFCLQSMPRPWSHRPTVTIATVNQPSSCRHALTGDGH